jgi:hypothetical protein
MRMRTYNNINNDNNAVTAKRQKASKSDRFRKLPELFQIIGVVTTVFILCVIFWLALRDYNDHKDFSSLGKSSRNSDIMTNNNNNNINRDHPNIKFLDKCHWTLSEDKQYFPSGAKIGRPVVESLLSEEDKQKYLFRSSSSSIATTDYFPQIYCEGYWREQKEITNNNNNKLPFPEARSEPFCGQAEVLEMLKSIEQNHVQLVDSVDAGMNKLLANAIAPNTVMKFNTRGLSMSRLEKDKLLESNAEYFDRSTQVVEAGGYVCWTGDLASHYISKFNVRPSVELIRYLVSRNYPNN